MDIKAARDKQVSEFLYEFKNRFQQVNPYIGMPGILGYSAKLNRQDVNANLQIFLTERFPNEAPIIVVLPPFQNEIIDSKGKVTDDCLRLWNLYSTLKNCVTIILNKLESKQQQSFFKQPEILQVNPVDEDQDITNELNKDLSSKSIEELIYINYNPEHYVYQFTQKQREANMSLLQEVSEISKGYEIKKQQYEETRLCIEQCKKEFEQKEQELRELYNQKQLLDNKFTVDKLIEELKKNIDENYQKPRQRLINEFMAKKIDFDSFKEDFKDLSMKFHYYSLIRDKLNLYR